VVVVLGLEGVQVQAVLVAVELELAELLVELLEPQTQVLVEVEALLLPLELEMVVQEVLVLYYLGIQMTIKQTLVLGLLVQLFFLGKKK
jgi:hypothetical protein